MSSPSQAARPEIPAHLLRAIRNNTCAFFIGSGVSSAAGIRSAAILSDALAEEVREYERSPDVLRELDSRRGDLAKMATLHGGVFTPQDAKTRICAWIEEDQRNATTDIHRLLPRLRTVSTIVTTNYDQLIEQSYDVRDRHVVRTTSDLGVQQRLTQIFKIHGCVTAPSEILLDVTDYATFASTRRGFADEMRALLRRNTFVFIGYSLQDMNILTIAKEVAPDSSTRHFYVSPDAALLQHFTLSADRYEHIRSDARSFLEALVEAVDADLYGAAASTSGAPVATLGDSRSGNPFEMYDTEALASADAAAFVQYFIPPVKYREITGKHNTVIEGHRGSGKSMVFRYLSILNDDVRVEQLPFFGFYVKLESGYFDGVERGAESERDWSLRFQHYFNLVVATGIIENILVACDTGVLNFDAAAEGNMTARVQSQLLRSSTPVATLRELQDSLYRELDDLRNDQGAATFRTPPRFMRELLHAISAHVPKLRSKWWLLLLDEWDNLAPEQQRVVVMRLHDRDSDLRYKVAVKTLGFTETATAGRKVDLTHDYSFERLDHHLFDDKSAYIEFLRRVGSRRLELYGSGLTTDQLLPAVTALDADGEPDYSGFESFAMLSSGVVREFLELCKDAVYIAQPELFSATTAVAPVPPKWQNHVARIHSAIHFNNYRGCRDVDHAHKLIVVLGAVFNTIRRATRHQAEYRTPLGIDITDYFNVDELSKRVLHQCISNRLIQDPDRPLQPRNPEEGAKRKFVLHRLLCPYFKLTTSERYTVPLNAMDLQRIWQDPRRVIKDLTRYYGDAEPDVQLPLLS